MSVNWSIVIQRSSTPARSNILRPLDLPAELRQLDEVGTGPLQERLDAVECELLRAALEQAGRQTRR